MANPVEPPTPLERIGRGMTDVYDLSDRLGSYLALKLGRYTPAEYAQRDIQRNDAIRLYNEGTQGQPAGSDSWRAFGGFAAAAPLAEGAQIRSLLQMLAQGYAGAASNSNNVGLGDAVS